MSFRHFASLILATSVIGCAAQDGDDLSGAGGGKADGDTPVISFGDDWSERISGELLAGSPVRIEYDLDRLQDCRGSTNGSEVWGVGGYASFDGGEPVAFAVSRLEGGVVKPVVAEIEVPANTSNVQFWFGISNRWGCVAYDSNENNNYSFDVTENTRGPVIAFNADWSESQSGSLVAGQQVVVHYEPERLSQCATSRNGIAGWSVTMHYKVDGGPVKTMLVTRADGSDLVPADTALTIPRGNDLEVWFSASSTYGCNAYDSNLGGNYHFEIE